jgi:hypothetical protein
LRWKAGTKQPTKTTLFVGGRRSDVSKKAPRRLFSNVSVEKGYEGSCFREEDLQELQDRAPPAGRLRDLRGREAQAEAGLRMRLQATDYRLQIGKTSSALACCP